MKHPSVWSPTGFHFFSYQKKNTCFCWKRNSRWKKGVLNNAKTTEFSSEEIDEFQNYFSGILCCEIGLLGANVWGWEWEMPTRRMLLGRFAAHHLVKNRRWIKLDSTFPKALGILGDFRHPGICKYCNWWCTSHWDFLTILKFRGAVWPAQGDRRCKAMADCPGGQKGTGKLRDLHGKPPQSTRTTHPDEWEVEQTWQKADLAGRGIPDRAPAQKEKWTEGGSCPGELRKPGLNCREKIRKGQSNPRWSWRWQGMLWMVRKAHPQVQLQEMTRKMWVTPEYVTKNYWHRVQGRDEALSEGFASVFTAKASSRAAQLHGPEVFVWGRKSDLQ